MSKIYHNITAIAYNKKGKIISIGKNSYVKTHPLQMQFSRKAGNPHKIFIHAELDAIIRAHGKKIHKLVIIRKRIDGTYGIAKPCASCQLAIAQFGIKEVEYTV